MTTVQLPDEVQSAREITIGEGDILVIKHQYALQGDGRRHLHDWARELIDKIEKKVSIIVCPDSNDIAAMPRDDVRAMLQEMASAIDCDIVDRAVPKLDGRLRDAVLNAISCTDIDPSEFMEIIDENLAKSPE